MTTTAVMVNYEAAAVNDDRPGDSVGGGTQAFRRVSSLTKLSSLSYSHSLTHSLSPIMVYAL